jgi:carboxymethylenebutenolidase
MPPPEVSHLEKVMSLLEQEMHSQFPKSEVTRRSFILTTLGTGFAAAVQPVSAETIHTDSVGLTAGEVKIPVADGAIPAYRAQPTGKTDLPTILVVQEIFGVHEHIKDLCRRLAKEGYLAVAPALYAREGDPAQYDSVPELISKLVSKVPDEQVLSDLDATAAWAKSHHGSGSALAVTGFCWGGRITWLYAAHNPHVKAAAAWYGPLVGKTSPLTPRFPVDIAGDLKAPVLGQYGGKDQGILPEHIERMRAALAKASGPAAESVIVVYPDSPHGFNADYRSSYVEQDAKVAWARMLSWFRRYGVGQDG